MSQWISTRHDDTLKNSGGIGVANWQRSTIGGLAGENLVNSLTRFPRTAGENHGSHEHGQVAMIDLVGERSWDREAAWDLQMRAEQYIRERRPEGYRMSDALAGEIEPLRRDIGQAFETESHDAHERVVSRMVRLSLNDYARHERERARRPEAATC